MLPLLGPFAWVFGNQALTAIKAGTTDPAEKSTTMIGRACGMVGTGILILGVIVGIIYVVGMITLGRYMIKQTALLNDTPTASTQTASKPLDVHGDAEKLNAAIISKNAATAESIVDSDPGVVNEKGQSGETPLFTAAFVGSLPVAKILIQRGAKVNEKDDFGKTPLDNAQFFHHADIAALLIRHGAHNGAHE